MKLPYFKQETDYYCGPASLQMILDYFGKHISQKTLARRLKTNVEDGTDHFDLIRVATENNLYCYVNQNSFLQEIFHFLSRDLPVVIDFMEPDGNEAHYAVVIGHDHETLIVNDPWNGEKFRLRREWFEKHWYDYENNAKRWIMVLSPEDLCIGKQYVPKNER